MASFKYQPLYLFNMALGGPQNWSEDLQKIGNPFPCQVSNPCSLVTQSAAWSLHRLCSPGLLPGTVLILHRYDISVCDGRELAKNYGFWHPLEARIAC
jgi:hypothetical protein